MHIIVYYNAFTSVIADAMLSVHESTMTMSILLPLPPVWDTCAQQVVVCILTYT